MKISSVSGVYDVYRSKPAVSGKKSTGGSKKDDLKVSDKAKEFQVALKSALSSADIREDKIESIKERIENGTYNISAEDIADKIISHM